MIKQNTSFIRIIFLIVSFACVSLALSACNKSAEKYLLPSTNVTPTQTPESTTPGVFEPTVTPTPETPDDVLTVPLFSADGGFYETSFTLTLTTENDNEIYFTLDGSDPRTSESSMLYHSGINIYNNTNTENRLSAITDITLSGYNAPFEPVDKGIIVRAVSKAADGTFSEIVTNSYFVEKTASYYTDMKVISLVTDSDYLFDPDTGAYMVGSGYYDWLNSDEYEHYDSGDVQNPTNYNKDGRETEFPVSIQVFKNGTAVYTTNVGARISGNWSRAFAQKSLRFYARKEYGDGKMKYAFFDELTDTNGEIIQKFDKVTLRNGGNDFQTLHFRDALIQDLAKDLAPDTMASEPYILFLNGEFWGFYLLREKPDSDYIESHYGIKAENVAVLKNGGLESGEESDLAEFNEFCSWALTADMTDTQNYERFCSTMDLQSFMDYVTVETYVNNADWVTGYVNNWIVWHSKTVDSSNPKADGKWRFIFYDLDFTAGLYHSESTVYRYDSLNNNVADDSIHDFMRILRNLMHNETFAKQFKENYLHIIDTNFSPDVVDAKINEYRNAYEEATAATFFRFDQAWAAFNYANEIEHLKDFFRNRPAYAKNYLEYFCENIKNYVRETLPAVNRWTYYGPADFSSDQTGNAFYVNVPATTEESWNIQSQANGLYLEKGKQYRLTFTASCTNPTELSFGINRNDNGDYPSCIWQHVDLIEDLQTYTIPFTMESETHSDWRLCFNYGKSTGTYIVKDVELEEIP